MDLLKYKNNFRSQNGEDGIIKKIFDILGEPANKYFVEFGAWDGEFLSNTFNLMKNHHWGGVYIEGDSKKALQLKNKYINNNKITCVNSFVESGSGEHSLTKILQKAKTPKEFAILSIDIDGNDYEVWRDLNYFEPTLVIIEYNQTIPSNVEYVDYNGEAFMGSSCLSLTNLAKQKGYELICCTGTNCFFIKKEFFHLFDIEDNSPIKLQSTDYQCYVAINYAGELVFSNDKFFQNEIKIIIYKRFQKMIKHFFFRKKSFFFLGDKY